MIFQDYELEMRDGVGVLEAAVDDAVDHGFPLKCAQMLRNIVFRTQLKLDVFRQTFWGDPPARVEPMAVRLQPGARVVRAKPPPERNRSLP